jgi:phospholipid/cholesterol/gamma-HCH transport system ATP-binding protein
MLSSTPILNTTTETQGNQLVVEMRNIKKSFGDNAVLKDLNINLNREENLVVLGKSGSGKSVLIKCLVGLIKPDVGSMSVLGQNIPELTENELNSLRKKIGFLFQSGALYDSMTVFENLLFPLRDVKDLTNDAKKKLAEEVLASVGLEDTIHKMPSELSGGMRKRLGLARTIILKPEIMLYDEPTTGLDPITSKEISLLILDIQKKHKTASIIITHDMACAKLTANRMVVLKDGAVGIEGTYKELESSEDPDIRAFFE